MSVENIELEADEQMTVMQWAKLNEHLYKDLALLHHIPNGGSRNRLEAIHLKQQGVKAGVPDLCLPVPRCGFHGLYIEMKRRKNARASEAQKKWIAALRRQGYFAAVCYGADEAINLIEAYLSRILPFPPGYFDVVEEHHNCFVQVLRNSATGEESIGWRQE